MTVGEHAASPPPGLRPLPPCTAMTTEVAGWIPAAAPAAACARAVRRVFARVEARLTRFRPASELNRCCAAGGGRVSPVLFRALTTSARAWRRTGGLFDPRIRSALEGLGYDASLRFGPGGPARVARGRAPRPSSGGPWLTVAWSRGPALGRRRPHGLILQPAAALDLGGIGKGLALRYATAALRRCLGAGPGRPATFGPCGPSSPLRPGFLVDAGGDIWAEGAGPDGEGWPIAVAGPGGQSAAHLRVAGRAVCTSSRGRRAWLAGGRAVHHLIDPRSGRPADARLWSVTVIGRDPAWAEVWSKAIFIAGPGGARLAEARGIAALLVRPDGGAQATSACRRYLDGRPRS